MPNKKSVIDALVAERRTVRRLRKENARMAAAIIWALGYTNFRERREGEGAYYWRKELRLLSACPAIDRAIRSLPPDPLFGANYEVPHAG